MSGDAVYNKQKPKADNEAKFSTLKFYPLRSKPKEQRDTLNKMQ